MPKLTIALPQDVYNWAVEKAEEDYRTTEEWCSVLIRKAYPGRTSLPTPEEAAPIFCQPDKKKTGEYLRKLRKSKKVTQQELSKALGISCAAVAMFEAGKRFPCDRVKAKYAAFFEQSIAEIFYGPEVMPA